MTERALTRKQKRQAARRNVLTDESDNSIRIKNSLTVKEIKPLTVNQKRVIEEYEKGQHLFLSGLAGTGKTFLACALAIRDVLSGKCEQDKVVIVRSAVSVRDLGHLPGSIKEKTKIYELPYYSIFSEYFGRGDAYEILKSKQLVEFMTTSYVRGITLSNAIIIIDESQCMDSHELDSIVSRLGHNSRIILCGDLKQNDLARYRERSGMYDFLKIVSSMSEFSLIEFTQEDIVRSNFVREYIIARDKLESSGQIQIL